MGKGMGCVGSTPVNTDKVDDPSDAAPAADSGPVAKAEVKKYNGKAEMASIRRWRDSLPAPLQEIFKEKWNDETPLFDWSYVTFGNDDGDSPNLYSDVTDDMYLELLEINCDNDEEKHAFPPIGKFSNLKYLEISGPWSSFAKDFVQCTTLTSVTVRPYDIKSFISVIEPFISVIESNPDIENLNISLHGDDGDDAASAITSILPAICNLKKLETLDLNVWDVEMSPVVLPAGLSKLASLTSLTLSLNVDSKSFAVISKLPKLENLAIQAGHSITDDAKKDAWKSPIVLPAEFSKFASLTSLTFNDTAVDPKSLAVIPNLRDLTLGGFAWMYESEAVCNILRNMKHLVDFRCDGDTLGFATGGCTIKLPDDLKAEMFSRKRLNRWSDYLDMFLGNTLPNADDTYKALKAAANATDDDDDWDKLNEYHKELLISPKFVADKKKAIDDVGNDADAIAAYIKKNYVKVDDEDEEFEEEFRDISADHYGDDFYDVNDPNIRLLIEAAIAAYLDKFGYEGKTLDQIRAEFPTSFSLLAFYKFILPDTEEPDKADVYTSTDVYDEIGAMLNWTPNMKLRLVDFCGEDE